MFVQCSCRKILCVLLVFTLPSYNRASDDEFEFSGMPKSGKVSSSGQLEDLPPVVVVMPTDYYSEDPQLLHHPAMIKEILDKLQDHEAQIYKDQIVSGAQKQMNKNRSSKLDEVIEQDFSPNNVHENEHTDTNENLRLQAKYPSDSREVSNTALRSSSPFKIIVIKGGSRLPRRNLLRRRPFLNRLRSPILRSSQSNAVVENEHNSEEFIHNILETIDQEDSESDNPIKNAFLIKTTTFNITKLLDDSKNKSFLIEKIVNYSTNLNMMHSENAPTNYSNTHSSVMQTIVDLNQYNQTTKHSLYKDEAEDSDDSSTSNKNYKPNDFVGGLFISDINNKESDTLRMPSEKYNHQAPTEFLGGQYLPGKTFDGIQKQPKTQQHNPPDFVGGQFVSMNGEQFNGLNPKSSDASSLDSVEDKYIDMAVRLGQKPHGSLSLDYENNLGNFVSGQFIKEYKKQGNSLNNEDNIGSPNYFDGEQSKKILGSGELMTTMSNDVITTIYPETDIPSLSLTKEFLDINGKGRQTIESENDYESTTYIGNTLNKSPAISDEHKAISLNIAITKKPQTRPTDRKPSGSMFSNPGKMTNFNLPESEFKSEILEINDKKDTKISATGETTDSISDSFADDSSLSETPNISEEISDFSEVNNNMKGFKPSEEVLQKKVQKDPTTAPLERDEDMSSAEEDGRTNTDSTLTVQEKDSSENYEYDDNLKANLGINPTNEYETTFLETDLKTGKYVTERIETYKTQPYNKNLELSTISSVFNNENFETHQNGDFDIVGDASNLQPNKLKSNPTENAAVDWTSQTQVQNFTGLVDDVELFAGSAISSESVDLNTITEMYDSEGNNALDTLDIFPDTENGTNSEEDVTQLCLSLTKKENPTLLDLLTGKYYLVKKNGEKVPLQLKENPMENCNSGTKICNLFLKLLKESREPITEKYFEDIAENTITKNLYSKSKNGKRHITEEEAEMMKSELRTERSIHETTSEFSATTDTSQCEFTATTDTSQHEFLNETDHISTESIQNSTVKSQSSIDHTTTEMYSKIEGQSKDSALPIQSMFIRLPLPYKESTDGQRNSEMLNYNPESGGKRITLHSLDSRQIYDDKTKWNRHPHLRFGFSNKNRFSRKVHQKRDSPGHTEGACGCNNPLLLSPSPIPDYRHFVGKRLAILTNIVHTVKDWVKEDPLRN